MLSAEWPAVRRKWEALQAKLRDSPPSERAHARCEALRFEARSLPGLREILQGLAGPLRGELCGELLGRRYITADMALALIGSGLVALSELALPWQGEIREERKRRGGADDAWVRHTLAIINANIRSRCLCGSDTLPRLLSPVRSLAESLRALSLDDWIHGTAPQEWARELSSAKSAYGGVSLWARASLALDMGERALITRHRSPRFCALFERESALLENSRDDRAILDVYTREAWETIIRGCLVPLLLGRGYDLGKAIEELREAKLLQRQILRLSFRELVLLVQSPGRALIRAELPRSLDGALQALLEGRLNADFALTREAMASVREIFIRDALAVLILADQNGISSPS